MGWRNRRYVFVSIGFLLCLKIGVSNTTNKPVYSRAENIQPLTLGTPLPMVSLVDLDGKLFPLEPLINKGPFVLVFYRGGWCPFCNIQLGELQKILPEIKALKVPLIAISPDRPSELKKSVANLKLDYQLLSDSSMKAAQAFGIAFKVEEELIKKYKSWNINLDFAAGMKHHRLPVPAVFIFNKHGRVAYVYANPNYKVRLNHRELLAEVKFVLQNKNKKPE